MAIFYYKFDKPLNVSDASQIDLESSGLFAKKKEIPAGFNMDITPDGYRDKYVLRTRIDPRKKDEDTIGEVEVTKKGKKISFYEGAWEGGKGGLVESEEDTLRKAVDSELSTFFLCRPNALEGGQGLRVDGIIRYVPSGNSKGKI